MTVAEFLHCIRDRDFTKTEIRIETSSPEDIDNLEHSECTIMEADDLEPHCEGQIGPNEIIICQGGY